MFNGKYFEWNQKRIKAIVDFYGHKFFYMKKILDLGCGHGDLGGVLYRLGADVTGVDARQEHLKMVSKKFSGIKVIKADLDKEWPFSRQKFDLVLDLGLICHLNNYEDHIKKACSSTTHLVIETAVCDSTDTQKFISVDEDKTHYDLAYNGKGCLPSSAAIERVLKECGMNFKRMDNSKLNTPEYQYDWRPSNDGSSNVFKRKMWFCVKENSPIQFVKKPIVIIPPKILNPSTNETNIIKPNQATFQPNKPISNICYNNNIDLTVATHILQADGIGRQGTGLINELYDDLKINILKMGPANYKDIPSKISNIANKNFNGFGKVTFWTYVLGFANDQTVNIHKTITSPFKIAYSMLESDAIPNFWADILNKYYDMVVVPDEYFVSVYKNSGVKIPIFVVPLGISIEGLLARPVKTKPNPIFTFGMSAGFYKRKCHIEVLQAFGKLFGNNPNYRLKLHGRLGPYKNEVENAVKKAAFKNVELIVNPLSPTEYDDFLESIDCYVYPSMGEGFSISPREILALNIPCILSNNTAHKTICNSGFVIPLDLQKRVPAIYETFGNKQVGCYFKFDDDELIKLMKDVANNYSYYLDKAKGGREWAKQYLWSNLKPIYLNMLNPTSINMGDINLIDKIQFTTTDEKLYSLIKSIFQTTPNVEFINKKRGLFINSKKSICSIYESGYMCYQSLLKSEKFILDYTDEKNIPPGYDFYIFNYHHITNNWITKNYIDNNYRGKTFCIVTEVSNETNNMPLTPQIFDYYILLDPTIIDSNNIFGFPRPLEIMDIDNYIDNNIPIIGSFGMFTAGKRWDLIINGVQNEFDKAIIKFNIPYGDYVNDNSKIEEFKKTLHSLIKKPEIKLEITSNYMDKKDLIKWCSQNTLNCFFYERSGVGLSAVTDQAISSKRPLLVNNGPTFRHILKYMSPYPKIGLKEAIISNGKIVETIYNDWSPINFVNKFEKILLDKKIL